MCSKKRVRVITESITTDLSIREREVLGILIEAGATNLEIGQRLFITESTVKAHVAQATRKLGARNRTHLALLWSRREP